MNQGQPATTAVRVVVVLRVLGYGGLTWARTEVTTLPAKAPPPIMEVQFLRASHPGDHVQSNALEMAAADVQDLADLAKTWRSEERKRQGKQEARKTKTVGR